MKRTFFHLIMPAIAGVMLFGLAACNPDVQLGSEENIPEVAEHILGMTKQEAITYLEKQGFFFGNKAEYVDEYVFSRDGSLPEFSYEATAMLMFGTFEGDTVKYVSAVQRPKTEQAARDLYWKWSHYTAVVTLTKVEQWQGNLVVKELTNSPLKDKWTSYVDGSAAKQMVDNYRKSYEKGEITKQEYDMWVRVYSKTRDTFWTDFKREAENVDSAHEHYTDTTLPKEVQISYYSNNGGDIELTYETHNFVVRWI